MSRFNYIFSFILSDKIGKDNYKNFLIYTEGGYVMADEMGKMSIRIDLEDKEALAKYAKENDLTMSQLLRRMIKEFLRDNASKE